MSASPSDPPYLLLFDGVCNLCDGFVQFVLKHDRRGLIHFASIQSEVGSRKYREHGLNPDSPDSILFLTPEGPLRESDAALEIAALLGGLWPLARIFKLLPRWIRDSAYRFVATHRYQWFGKHDQCMLPRPEWRKRFLG